MAAARGPGRGSQDVLEQGDDRPRRPVLGLAGLVVLLLAAGGLAGHEVKGWLAEKGEPGGEKPALVAGTVEQDPRLTSDGFVLPLHNGTDHDVEILDVELDGWNAVAEKTTIAPGSWGDVAIDVTVDCETTPYPGREVAVRASAVGGEVEQVLRMPEVPGILTEEVDRLCGDFTGKAPSLGELAKIWLVERASRFAGEMLVELNRDGTFAMDRDVGLSADPGIFGTFVLSGHWLTLDAVGGHDCEAGSRGVFYVMRQEDGRLKIPNLTYSVDWWCGIDTSDVWIAKPVGPAPAAPTDPTAPTDPALGGRGVPGEDATARPGRP